MTDDDEINRAAAILWGARACEVDAMVELARAKAIEVMAVALGAAQYPNLALDDYPVGFMVVLREEAGAALDALHGIVRVVPLNVTHKLGAVGEAAADEFVCNTRISNQNITDAESCSVAFNAMSAAGDITQPKEAKDESKTCTEAPRSAREETARAEPA